jgi:hypothetical protein
MALLTQSALAAEKHVETPANGGNNANTGDLGSPWATVAYGLTRVADGDALHIGPGQFTEAGLTITNNIILAGAGKDLTFIQANSARGGTNTARTLSQKTPGPVTIRGITFRWANSAQGGYANAIYNSGVASYQMTMENCRLTQNDGNSTGTIAWGGNSGSGPLVLNNCEITENTSSAVGNNSGAGVFSYCARVVVSNCWIALNSTSNHGAAAFGNATGGAPYEFYDTAIVSNSAQNGRLSLRRQPVSDNSALQQLHLHRQQRLWRGRRDPLQCGRNVHVELHRDEQFRRVPRRRNLCEQQRVRHVDLQLHHWVKPERFRKHGHAAAEWIMLLGQQQRCVWDIRRRHAAGLHHRPGPAGVAAIGERRTDTDLRAAERQPLHRRGESGDGSAARPARIRSRRLPGYRRVRIRRARPRFFRGCSCRTLIGVRTVRS